MFAETDLERRRFCASLTLTVCGATLCVFKPATARHVNELKESPSMLPIREIIPVPARLPVERKMPSLDGATGWLNSPPPGPTKLSGQVILVSFWTYTCINWLRSLPYLRAWDEKYRNQGLVVIGVHTPEFLFEENFVNVRQAVKERTIGYPVAIDNDYAVWNAFKNEYWPAMYFVDRDGNIRHHQFGEGNYESSEKVIQQLLLDGAKNNDIIHDVVAVNAFGIEAAADWDNLASPETYLGYGRASNFISPGGAVANQRRLYTMPTRLGANQWALSGEWNVGIQAILLHKKGGHIGYRFHARDLHLVMGPKEGRPIAFRVRLNGQPPGEAHGIDVDASGQGTIAGQRLYQLVRQPGNIVDQNFDIEFLDAGAEVFAFTFG